MKKLIAILLCALGVNTAAAQQAIDLKGIFQGKYRFDNIQNLVWRPNGSFYSFIRGDTIYLVEAKTGKKTVMSDLSYLQAQFPDEKLSRMPSFQWMDENRLWFPQLDILWKTGDKPIKFPHNEVIAQDLAHQLQVIEKDNAVQVLNGNYNMACLLLCPDTGTHIVLGQTVHRSEWGINEGQYFSPNGNFIAFYRMDESMVEDYPLVDVTTPIATVNMIKYPMAGRTSHQVKVGIFDVKKSFETGKTVYHYLNTDFNDGEFLTNVTFSPDEKYVYITHLNRAQNHSKLIRYDVINGQRTATLVEERDSRYVEPQARPLFLKNGNFIWQSDRDGYNHCYLYDASGKLLKQLTSGKFPVMELLGLDAKEQFLYFVTNRNAPTDSYVYCLNMKNGALQNLTPEAGSHFPNFNSDMSFFIDYFSNLTTPRRIMLRSSDGKTSRELLNSKNPYSDCNLGNVSIFSIKNKAGDDLYCRLILPLDFDSTKKYPVFLYVYGGPHSQLVTNTFMSGGVFLHYMAQQGYIVFSLDNRGTNNRGAEFEKCIHRNLGVKEVEDQMCGVNWLKSKPFVDNNHIDLDGWSYGGFMTLSLLTAYPDAFHAATCGGPVVDWSKYEVMYGERYMDTPQENPDGYEKANILNKVDKIKTPLLVIHDGQDHTVVWQNTLQLLNAAIEKGVELDYFVYPNHDHNVMGIERVHLWNKILKFHNNYLKH
ncbi:MAG: S9 family peptidase [Bacteroidales bacterium]|nr:S9 family peptidase [Bacteroidales bacterium]